MKYLFWVCFSLLSVSFLSAQDRSTAGLNKSAITPENTYAVIIGISNYENQTINLNYANRDAQVFAEYLQSKAGGLVPADNIRLLTDTNATTAAIYNSLNWLKDRCEASKLESDGQASLVYFYFSGHGDVETNTRANLGFLISYNTPPNNYINNAVRIEDLNHYAHTLSVDLNANVVIITDACHSGKLAGSGNRGSFLVGKELSMAREKEIRIASCNPDELSNEDLRWGGGRGVFSYYLINGLKGLADKNSDNAVTLSEIKTYVDSSIAADPVLIESKLKQTPVLEGNRQFKLAVVDQEEFLATQRAVLVAAPLQSNQEYFFDQLKNSEKLESVSYTRLKDLPKNKIASAFIREVKDIFTDEGLKKIVQLEEEIKRDSVKLNSFNESLVELLHTKGQTVINLYMQGDAAELERRRYYNAKSGSYANYPHMYSLALQLTGEDNPLSHILEVNHYYFTGIVSRLKLPFVTGAEQKIILEQALAAQKKALSLESNAAYINNELGILYYFKKEYALAEEYYTTASTLAPAWAIPWANLSGLYADMKKAESSIKAGEIAESLQADLQLTQSNLGLAYEISGNYLFAEEYFRKAIDINSRHYFPFERLGHVYMNTTQYALADSFFYEADLRKKGYNFEENELIPIPLDRVASPVIPLYCAIDTSIIARDDIMAFFYWGMQEYESRNYTNAQRVFKKVVAWDNRNPLIFHYMGKIFYDQQKWEEAELMFKMAIANYRDYDSFLSYSDSVVKGKVYHYPHECFELYFRAKYYENKEDHYFLGTLYEAWAHYEESEKHYRELIQAEPFMIGGYIKLWRMMEKTGRYTESEKIIKSYAVRDKERTERELNAFYKRAIAQFPDNGDWYYRLGLMLYEKSQERPMAVYLDTIIWFPKINREVFMDMNSYFKLNSELSWDKNIPGSPQVVYWKDIREEPVWIVLPGINEQVQLEDPIYTPRKDAVFYLLKADSLLTETETKADINFKVGNIFVWSGSKKQAYPYYVRSVDLSPANASARLRLVDMAGALYKNRSGLEQLAWLYDQQQINFPKRLLYAEYSIHSAQFEKAKKLLEEAQAIYPYILPEAFDLMGRLYLLSKEPEKAIPWYNDYMATKPKDPFTLYTLARLYARSGKTGDAWKYLETAMKNGFNYMYVLKTDDAWKDLRKNVQWASLLKKYPPRAYSFPGKN